MRRIRLAPLAIFLLISAVAANAQAFDKQVATLTDKYASKAIEQRQQMHRNPELGNREVKTAELVAAHLRSLGLEVKTGVAHTGVVAILKGGKPGPVIAVRADMDALPVTEATDVPYRSTARGTYLGKEVGLMHACGHDVHTAVGLGVASVLSEMRAQLPGTVMFVFQPAEEGVPADERGGAELMLEEGIFNELKPAAVVGLHTNGSPVEEEFDDEILGRISYTPGPAMAASTRWMATVRGRGAHGAAPHLGIDPIVTASQVVMGLQTIRARNLPPLTPSVVTVGLIRGGERNNIIPPEVYMEGTIRTFDNAVHTEVQKRMREIFDGITKSAGASFELTFDRTYPVTKNDEALTSQMVPTLERVLGKNNVRRRDPITGAEDFAFFSNAVPGFYYFIGVVPAGKASTGHHTSGFYADDQSVPLGIKVMSTVVLDYLAAAKK